MTLTHVSLAVHDGLVTNEDLRAQAGVWVDEEIRRLRCLDYAALREYIDTPVHEALKTSGGTSLERATQVFWEGGPHGSLRVMVSVWGPPTGRRWRLVRPVAVDDFIRASDGTFVGEGPVTGCNSPC
jgi:hypothetical protein